MNELGHKILSQKFWVILGYPVEQMPETIPEHELHHVTLNGVTISVLLIQKTDATPSMMKKILEDAGAYNVPYFDESQDIIAPAMKSIPIDRQIETLKLILAGCAHADKV